MNSRREFLKKSALAFPVVLTARKSSGARLFVRASSQYYESTDPPVTTYPVTASCWVKFTSLTALNAIISFGRSTDDRAFRLLSFTDNKLYCDSKDDSGLLTGQSSTGATLTTGTWFHALGIWSGAAYRQAFLNGVGASASTASGATTGCNRMWVGQYIVSGSPGRFLDGNVNEVAIWNSVLSQAEIDQLSGGGNRAKACSPLRIAQRSLVFFAPFVNQLAGTADQIDTVGGRRLVASASPVDSNNLEGLRFP
jgi:hypothetical protein